MSCCSGAESASRALVADPEGATASVVLNSFTEIGLERLVGRSPAWVNVSREFVLERPRRERCRRAWSGSRSSRTS